MLAPSVLNVCAALAGDSPFKRKEEEGERKGKLRTRELQVTASLLHSVSALFLLSGSGQRSASKYLSKQQVNLAVN